MKFGMGSMLVMGLAAGIMAGTWEIVREYGRNPPKCLRGDALPRLSSEISGLETKVDGLRAELKAMRDGRECICKKCACKGGCKCKGCTKKEAKPADAYPAGDGPMRTDMKEKP